MAFADPQSTTIGGTAVSLPRISSGVNSSMYSSSDKAVRLTVSHNYGKRERHLVRLDNKKLTADPLQANVNFVASMSAYLVVDVPVSGFTAAEQKALVDALTGYLVASSGARVTQLLGGEN